MKPLALARALSKLETNNIRDPMQMRNQNPAHASLFIVNPFRGGGFVSIFSTHPPVKERIKRLQTMASKEGYLQ
jgi:heat shock protein HtpX